MLLHERNNQVEPASELRRIALAAIKIDPAIQQRVAGTSHQVVEEYAQAMRDGDAFPPPIVFSTDGVTYHLADGFHRVAAHRLEPHRRTYKERAVTIERNWGCFKAPVRRCCASPAGRCSCRWRRSATSSRTGVYQLPVDRLGISAAFSGRVV
jgi:hypothetical protein